MERSIMMDPARVIENLIYRYAELIDAGELEALAALFRQAVIVAPDGSETSGQEAVLQLYRQATRIYPDTDTPCTRHVTSNVQIEINEKGDAAESRSYFTVFQALPDFPLQAIIAGHYVDKFSCREDGWQFSRREMYPLLFGDLSRHLLFDADTIK
jgi:3-phenylpropionate/cinnamic acid dioxygenase small subunit